MRLLYILNINAVATHSLLLTIFLSKANDNRWVNPIPSHPFPPSHSFNYSHSPTHPLPLLHLPTPPLTNPTGKISLDVNMKFRAQRCFDLGILHVTDIACRSMDGLTVTSLPHVCTIPFRIKHNTDRHTGTNNFVFSTCRLRGQPCCNL